LKRKIDINAIAKKLNAGFQKRRRVPHVVTATLADAIDDAGVLTEEDVATVHKALQRIADRKGQITTHDVVVVGERLEAIVEQRSAKH